MNPQVAQILMDGVFRIVFLLVVAFFVYRFFRWIV